MSLHRLSQIKKIKSIIQEAKLYENGIIIDHLYFVDKIKHVDNQEAFMEKLEQILNNIKQEIQKI